MIIFRDFVKWANVQEAKQFHRLYGDEPVNIEEVRDSMDSPHWEFWYHYSLDPVGTTKAAMAFISLCAIAILVPFDTPTTGSPPDMTEKLKELVAKCCQDKKWEKAAQLETLVKAYDAVASKRYFRAIVLASTALGVGKNEKGVTARVRRVVQNLWKEGDSSNVG